MTKRRYDVLKFSKSEVYRIISPLSHHIFQKLFLHSILLIIRFNLMPNLALRTFIGHFELTPLTFISNQQINIYLIREISKQIQVQKVSFQWARD